MSNPLMVAETAGRTAHRRRVGGVVVMLSAIAGAAIIWIVSATMVVPALLRAGVIGSGPPAGALRTETVKLSCLSPQQAGDIINPYVRGHGSMYYVPNSGIAAITVRGTADEVAQSRTLIRKFERDPSAACRSTETSVRSTVESIDRALEEATKDLTPEQVQENASRSTREMRLKGPHGLKGSGLLDPNGGPTLLTPDRATTAPKKE